MNFRQRLFTEYYLSTGNATEAARRAGYSGSDETLAARGYDLVNLPEIKEAIEDRIEEAAMEADEILGRITTLARTDLFDWVDVTESGAVVLNLKKGQQAGKGICVKKWVPTRYGDRIEFHDPLVAHQVLAKMSGLLKEAISSEEMIAFIKAMGAAQEESPA